MTILWEQNDLAMNFMKRHNVGEENKVIISEKSIGWKFWYKINWLAEEPLLCLW